MSHEREWLSGPRPTAARYRSPNLPPTNAVAVPAARTIHLLNTGPPHPPVVPLPVSPSPRQPAGTLLRAVEARADAPGDLPPLTRRLAAHRTRKEPRSTVRQGTRTGLMARPTARPRLGREWGSRAAGWALVLGILALGAVAGTVLGLLLAWWFGWPGVL